MELPDHTWHIQWQKDGMFQAWELGTGRKLGQLPAKDFSWISGSKVRRRFGALVGGQYEVWDVTTGKMLHSAPCPHRYRGYFLSLSGRHFFLTDDASAEVQIIDVDRRECVARIPTRARAAINFDFNDSRSLTSSSELCFSPDGRWLMLITENPNRERSLELWDLELGKPIWHRQIENATDNSALLSTRRWVVKPCFDASSRYFSLNAAPNDTLIDVSTTPPTDLSGLIDVSVSYRELGDGKYVALSEGDNPTECRIWDLDRRKLIACHHASKFQGMVLTPDHQLAIVSQGGEPTTFEKHLAELLKWLGQSPTNASQRYMVIDLKHGGIVNRFSGGGLDQFDPDISQVWTIEHIWGSGKIFDWKGEFQRFPLRSAAVPWWLWGVTIIGLTLTLADGFRRFRRGNSVNSTLEGSQLLAGG